jgi:hypothetical protein
MMRRENGDAYKRLALVVSSKIGDEQPQQIVFVYRNDKWQPELSDMIAFKSRSVEFKIVLRYWDHTQRAFFDAPNSPLLSFGETAVWEATLSVL